MRTIKIKNKYLIILVAAILLLGWLYRTSEETSSSL